MGGSRLSTGRLMSHITSLGILNVVLVKKKKGFAFDVCCQDLMEMRSPHKTSTRKEFVTGLV